MAQFHPRQLGRKATYGERQVFERLHELDDGWLVLSSLPFLWNDGRGRMRPGEADFVLMHPNHGILILEVKDATYEVKARQWYRLKGSKAHPEKSPFEQAAGNRYKITNHLNEAGVHPVPICHCVLFTHGRPSGNLGPDAPDRIVLTLATLDNVRGAVISVIQHWQNGGWRSRQDFERAVQVLSPDVLVAATLDYDVEVSLGEIHRLTDEQVKMSTRQLEAVRATSGSPRSLILGGAGTGKTFVAFRYARTLASEGKQVAVFGAPSVLRVMTRRSLSAQGVHSGDVYDILGALYPEESLEGEIGSAAWEVILDLIERRGTRLDALLVDEAQSVDPDVLASMIELVKTDGQVALFADPFQRDSTGTWRPNGDYSMFWLTENCRNTVPIGKVVARVAGSPTPVSGANGRIPVLLHDADLIARTVAAVQDDLKSMAPSDMVVLTRGTQAARRVHEGLQRAGVRASRRLRDGYVGVCTVDEFRGCEAKSVVYLAETVPDPDTRTMDYLAVSRACAHLRVVGDPEQWSGLAFLFDSGGVA